jgi:hypothetical protein
VSAISPLELLHPAGRVDRVLVLGDGCPGALIPPAAHEATAGVDLVLIAPSAHQVGERGWLERAAGAAAQRLSQDGFAYALVPRGARREARRRLRAAGLELADAIVQLPGGDAPRYLVPLRAEPWRHALTEQIGARPRARLALRAARAVPGGTAALVRALPSVGIVARHAGAKPLADWVAGLGGDARPAAHAVVATSWRGPAGATVMRCFEPADSQPWGVAKVGPGSAGEARALEQLGSGAREAGARIPRLLAGGRLGDRPVLVETLVTGSPAARELRRSPGRFAELAGAIADWLERWNRDTREIRPSGRRLDTELPDLVRELALPDAYGAWLAERSRALDAGEPPLVARHNDLTMWNVLVDRGDAIGVLDWAEAEPAGLPLTDFFYAIADAAAACDGYRDRPEAVRACFASDGRLVDLVAPLRERLRTSLGLTAEAAELCFHACWLHHARNEQRSGEDGPFREIARWLARRPEEPA